MMSRIRTFLAACLFVIFTSNAANAQIMETFGSNAKRLTSEGRLIGCALNFDGVLQDFLYSSGGLISISGSINFNENRTVESARPFVGIKLVVQDAVDSQEGLQLTPSRPSFVVPLGPDNRSTRAFYLQSVVSDTPGSWLGAYNIDSLGPIIERLAGANEVALAFNRREGGSDLLMVFDLTRGPNGEDTGSENTERFLGCVSEMASELEERLKEN